MRETGIVKPGICSTYMTPKKIAFIELNQRHNVQSRISQKNIELVFRIQFYNEDPFTTEVFFQEKSCLPYNTNY